MRQPPLIIPVSFTLGSSGGRWILRNVAPRASFSVRVPGPFLPEAAWARDVWLTLAGLMRGSLFAFSTVARSAAWKGVSPRMSPDALAPNAAVNPATASAVRHHRLHLRAALAATVVIEPSPIQLAMESRGNRSL